MIVFSLPRCGGTKYCMDIAEKTGLEFVGDMSPGNILEFGAQKANVKKSIHETLHDQSLSLEKYIEVLKDHKDYIILANESNHFLLPVADEFILRKNINAMMYSYANWLIRGRAYWHFPILKGMLLQAITTTKLVYSYVNNNSITPIWYEEYFNNYPCNTPALDAYEQKQDVIDLVESHCLNSYTSHLEK